LLSTRSPAAAQPARQGLTHATINTIMHTRTIHICAHISMMHMCYTHNTAHITHMIDIIGLIGSIAIIMSACVCLGNGLLKQRPICMLIIINISVDKKQRDR
jgi:hypothetical protein